MKRRQEEGGAPQRAGAGRRGGRGSPRGGRGSPRAGRWPGLVPVGRLGGSVHLLLQAGSEVREAVDGWGTRAPRAVEGRPGPMSMGSEGSRETPAATPKGGARERAREGPSGGSQESAGEGGHGGQEGSPIREEPPGSGATPFTGQGPGHSRAPLDRVSRGGGSSIPRPLRWASPGSGLRGTFPCFPEPRWVLVLPVCASFPAAAWAGLTWGPAWGPTRSPLCVLLQVSRSLSFASFSPWGFASPRTLLHTFPRDTPITSVHLVPA